MAGEYGYTLDEFRRLTLRQVDILLNRIAIRQHNKFAQSVLEQRMAMAGRSVPFSASQVRDVEEELDNGDEDFIAQRLISRQWEKREEARKRGRSNSQSLSKD